MRRESALLGLGVALVLSGVSCQRVPREDSEASVQEWEISAESNISFLMSAEDYCGTERLGDGRFVVCDKGQEVLRVFDAGGRPLGTWGGLGEELGRFRILVRLGPWDGDSLLAVDRFRLSATVFSPDGTAARRFKYAVPNHLSGILETKGVFPDGAILSSYTLRPTAPMESLEWFLSEGPVPDSTEFGLLDGEGYDMLGRSGPGGEFRVHGGKSTHLLVPPLANRRLIAVGVSTWATAWSHDLRVTIRGRSGSDIRTFFVYSPSDLPSATEVEAIRGAWLNDGPELGLFQRQRLLDIAEDDGQPPLIGGLLMGPRDEVWVGGVSIPGKDAVWTIYTNEGESIGNLTVPSGTRLLQVMDGFAVLATSGVHTVQVREFWREPRTSSVQDSLSRPCSLETPSAKIFGVS